MKKVLITGINGFLGKHLLDKLLDDINFPDIDKIVGIDNFISSKREEEYIDNIKYTYSIIEKTLNKEKIDKTLIVIPTRKDFQFHGYNKKYKNLFWYEELLKLTAKHNITLIDLYDHFEIKNQYKYYHECDGHWNSYGHLNAAKIYLEHKEQKK